MNASSFRPLVLICAAAIACAEPRDLGGGRCRTSDDCRGPEKCIGGQCLLECREDRDCESRAPCVSNRCVGGQADGGGLGEDGGVSADGGSPGVDGGSAAQDGGQSPDGGSVGPDGGVTDAGTPVPGQYGDECARALDCANGLCVYNPITDRSICTIQCSTDTVCHRGHACLSAGVSSVCVPSDAGTPCPDGQGTSCVYGLCLVHPVQVASSVCSTPCSASRACPPGFACSTVNVGGSPTRVCMPVGSACNLQGSSNQCLSRWCSTQPQAPQSDGACTSNCRTAADCPDGWACGWDEAGPQSVVDVCQPLESAGHVLSCFEDASQRNNCYSKVCALTAGTTGYCTAFCMSTTYVAEPARCPAGWSCVAVLLDPTTTGYACERP